MLSFGEERGCAFLCVCGQVIQWGKSVLRRVHAHCLRERMNESFWWYMCVCVDMDMFPYPYFVGTARGYRNSKISKKVYASLCSHRREASTQVASLISLILINLVGGKWPSNALFAFLCFACWWSFVILLGCLFFPQYLAWILYWFEKALYIMVIFTLNCHLCCQHIFYLIISLLTLFVSCIATQKL